MLGRLAVRYPIPPVSEPWQLTGAEASEAVAAQIAVLGEQQERLGVPSQIALLNSPDHAVQERAAERLEAVTNRNYGRNAEAWTGWWQNYGPAWRAEAASISAGPLEVIGGARFTDSRQALTQAAAVLNFLGLHAALFDMSAIRDVQHRTIMRVARQVVVLGIDRAIRAGNSGVRGAAAQAAALVLDPAFGASLAYALPREKDGVARARIIEALANYPGKETIALLLIQLRDDDRTVTTHAQRALVAISGEDFGPEPTAWQLWWDQTGKSRWP
jgi:HEAT repeat protein